MWNRVKKDNIFVTVLLTLGLLLSCQPVFGQCASDDPSSPVGVTPTLVLGNPVLCEGGIRIDPPVSGTYDLDAFGNTVTVTIGSTDCGQVFSWSVPDSIVIDHVIAKGGPNANDYDYTGENPHPTSDGNLHSPTNESGNYAGLSHIDFCYHYELTISKTATAEFKRTYDWSIDKSCDGPDPLTLSEAQVYNYPFSWTAKATYTDSEWKVTGTITIENNTPLDATITSITDVLSGPINAVVSCPETLPYVLPSGQTLECTYSADLPGADDGTNTVTVVTSTPLVEGGTATADYTFGDPTELVDECITVTDGCGDSVEVCYDAAPHTEYYTCPISYAECGDYTYTNTASFTTNDQGVTDSDSCPVTVNVTCPGEGCTLTPGYWKTHSEYGPAPYDDTWANLPNGAATPFFLSGQSYFEVLWTSPRGNAYYILAHQYIAAELNFLNGADPTDAQSESETATAFFQSFTPDEVAGFKGQARKEWVDLAAVLDYYNNGVIGPGHCDEETDAQWDVLLAPQNSGLMILSFKTTLDYNRDGKVNIKDLLLLIEAWGSKESKVDIRLKSSNDGRVNPEGLEVQVIGVSK